MRSISSVRRTRKSTSSTSSGRARRIALAISCMLPWKSCVLPSTFTIVAVFERAVVVFAGVPQPGGDRAAAVGELELQVEVAVAVRAQLLVGGQEDLADLFVVAELAHVTAVGRGGHGGGRGWRVEESRGQSRSHAHAILGQRAMRHNQLSRVPQHECDSRAAHACLRMRLRRRKRASRLSGSRLLTLDSRPHHGQTTAICDQPDSGRELSRVVSASREGGRPGRELRRARLHGHQAVGLRDLGEHAAAARRDVQGDRARERLLPAVHSDELSGEGGGARRGVREGVRGGDAPSAGAGWEGRAAAGAVGASWKSR